jgi:Flp pilus assembly pilin Flp
MKRTTVRGAVLVEYALLLTAIAIPVMMGIVAGGAAMMKDYKEARDHILRPFP